MTHPYKPTIFALNTHKLDVLPDPQRSGTSIEVGRRGTSPVSSGNVLRTTRRPTSGAGSDFKGRAQLGAGGTCSAVWTASLVDLAAGTPFS